MVTSIGDGKEALDRQPCRLAHELGGLSLTRGGGLGG
jgi:hypothetical protein